MEAGPAFGISVKKIAHHLLNTDGRILYFGTVYIIICKNLLQHVLISYNDYRAPTLLLALSLNIIHGFKL